MTVTKNRDTSSGINVPTILGFAESFIDSCDPELVLLTLQKSLQDLCLLLSSIIGEVNKTAFFLYKQHKHLKRK